jgi:hypothetical protein
MSRTSKPWFDQQTGWWTVWIGRKRERLAKGKKNKKAANERLADLRAAARLNPAPDQPDQTVASIIEFYEASNRKHLAPDTYSLRHFYLQSFAEFCGWNHFLLLRGGHGSLARRTPRLGERLDNVPGSP